MPVAGSISPTAALGACARSSNCPGPSRCGDNEQDATFRPRDSRRYTEEVGLRMRHVRFWHKAEVRPGAGPFSVRKRTSTFARPLSALGANACLQARYLRQAGRRNVRNFRGRGTSQCAWRFELPPPESLLKVYPTPTSPSLREMPQMPSQRRLAVSMMCSVFPMKVFRAARGRQSPLEKEERLSARVVRYWMTGQSLLSTPPAQAEHRGPRLL